MSNIKIRKIESTDWEIYKELRLRSLQESPEAFGATYSAESKLPDEIWKLRCEGNGSSQLFYPVIAEHEGTPCGLAWSVVHETKGDVAHIYQMWVSPDTRGLGLARAMIEKIITWAKDNKIRQLKLDVTTTNQAAISLYKAIGFVPHGQLEPLRKGSNLTMQPMTLPLQVNVA